MGTAEMTPKFTHFRINLRAIRERQMLVGIIEIIETVNLSFESILFSPGECRNELPYRLVTFFIAIEDRGKTALGVSGLLHRLVSSTLRARARQN